MKIAIVGEKERAAAWEKHLRKLTVVTEVVITNTLSAGEFLDAVLLIDDTPENLVRLLHSVKAGFHTYLVSKLPANPEFLEKIYHASEESSVKVQFSHWPSMAESMNWLKEKISKPDLIQIKKESKPVNHRAIESNEFDQNWIDELALIIKWLGGNIHRYEVKPITLGNHKLGLNLVLRFENSSAASVQYLGSSDIEMHQRIFSNKAMLADCNVLSQKIRWYTLNDLNKITVRENHFDRADTAEWSAVQFIKSIQLNRPTLFTAYDALLTAKAAAQIKSLIEKH